MTELAGVDPILTVKGRGFMTDISNTDLAYGVPTGKGVLGHPSKTAKTSFVALNLRPVNTERRQFLPVNLYCRFSRCDHLGKDIDELIANKIVLLANQISVFVRLSKGLETDVPILNVIKDFWIKGCGFRLDVLHPILLGAELPYHASSEDMHPA